MMRAFACAAILLLFGICTSTFSQPYPTRPIRLVVGFAPGGAADTVARTVGAAMSRELGQPVVIENRAGPDGYSLLIASPSSISVNPALNPKLNYRPQDLLPITKITASPLVIAVNPATGITSVKELIAADKKSPGKLNYASAGNGSAPHFGGALFNQVAGTSLVNIPYKGGAPAVASVVAGDTQVTFATPPSVLPMIQAGRLRALAVTSRDRSPLMPEIPGMSEAGLPQYGISFWYGFFVPLGTPPDIVKKLFEATTVAMKQAEVKEALAREGTEVTLSRSPEEFAAFLNEDSKFWARLAKESGATID